MPNHGVTPLKSNGIPGFLLVKRLAIVMFLRATLPLLFDNGVSRCTGATAGDFSPPLIVVSNKMAVLPPYLVYLFSKAGYYIPLLSFPKNIYFILVFESLCDQQNQNLGSTYPYFCFIS